MALLSTLQQPILKLSELGERRGWDWLTYNPGIFAIFHIMALRDGPKVTGAMQATFPEARSFADVGAGSGAYAALLRKAGMEVIACEHSPVGRRFASLQHVDSIPFDLTQEPPAHFDGTVDVAYSFEVGEHLPPALGTRMVRFLLELAPAVVFSSAQPGQDGQGHINLQPLSYWQREFEEAGATLDVERTEQFTASLREREASWWLPANAQVFTRR
jgi:SAM-dependent methyltransferase